jgi:hypothetical protein
MPRLRRFLVCYESSRTDGRVWAIRVGQRWRLARKVVTNVSLETCYKGPSAQQPRAYLTGKARSISIKGGIAVIG